MVEHFFGTLRKIVKEFDALDFLQSYAKVEVLQRAMHQLGTDAAGSAQGYHHTYQNLHNLNLTALGTYPGDGDIEAIAVKAALAASDILKGLRMWDIIEERDIEKRKQAPLPDILVDDEATSAVRQGVPPNVDEAGLNQVLDRLRLIGSEPLPCILRREERDAILSAFLSVTALDIDQEARIDAVDAGFDQADAEEEDRQLQTILAEACHEHEQSWEAPPYPRHLLEKGALYSVPTLDLDSLLAQRRAHQCRHLEKIKFKGGAQNVASDPPFAQDRTEHRERHEIALEPHWFRVQTERIKRFETMGMDRYRQFVGNEGNLRFSNSGANIREKTLHEQATTAIITEGRFHDKMKGRQEVYGRIMSNHVLVRAVDGDVSALHPLKVDTLVVYGIPEEPTGLPSGEQCRERLAIGIVRNIYKKSSTTYESVESVDSLALVANAVIQELRVIAPGVYSNLGKCAGLESSSNDSSPTFPSATTSAPDGRVYPLQDSTLGVQRTNRTLEHVLLAGSSSIPRKRPVAQQRAVFHFDQTRLGTLGLPVFRVFGRRYHRLGALIPAVNQRPAFAQIWLIDLAEATDTRLGHDGADSRIQRSTLTKLESMLRTKNHFVREFASAKARAGWDTAKEWILRLCLPPGRDRRTHNLPTSSTEMAMLICDSDTNTGDRGPQDLILQVHGDRSPDGWLKYQVVSSLHPSAMPLRYPLLFPAGEDGFHPNISLCGVR
ncbi:hypothetical protein MVLG_06694 [Microbotryum lychnidis-dioicae p1A1 Lamole]|uniref:Uncharacterized protein n=1 Tax=Microbotryum lychnidis-dioicae (strain p1A1 Lamole / MvSl-1064) TaxID=683840 RepID=U5HI27_USTV1|nr:hypothetical protein MVLG_06694 [Microbotryum lychnidis-dioicae p1A1 Lamole]|eukprot:KDE02772.1 hypothetical protein MVLG_06694 [Microbotryum lychnidis-dioicae p1A1 Lamole]